MSRRAVVAMKQREDEKIMNYVVGEVMKLTSGRANPKIVRALIVERLARLEAPKDPPTDE